MIDKTSLDIEALLKEQELYENPLTEKQADILRAAEKLFTEMGFSETPTAAIAKEAKVTEKTLFKHFPTKSHLLRRVLFPILVRTFLPAQMRKMRNLMHEPFENYHKFFESLAMDRWTMARETGPRLKFMLVELLSNDKLRQQLGQIWTQNLWGDILERIENCQKAGEIRSDISAETIARMQIVIIAGHALFFGILARDKDYNFEEQAKVLAKLFHEGVRPQPDKT